MPNIATLLDEHVVLKYECLDRIFLNGYVAKVQDAPALAWFLTNQRGEEIPRYALLGEMTRDFVAAVERLAAEQQIPMVHFERGQRKETVAAPYFAATEREGVVMLGIAQEKANVFRAPAKAQREPGAYAATRGSAYVKYLYFYIFDNDWGPSFIKVCTYAPWSMRIWLNGHQWLKRQLARQQVDYEPLDNGIAAVADPTALRRTAMRLSAAHIQRYFDRWMYRLPNPFRRGTHHALDGVLMDAEGRRQISAGAPLGGDQADHGAAFCECVAITPHVQRCGAQHHRSAVQPVPLA